MFAEGTMLAAVLAALALVFAAGFFSGRAWVRALQIILMLMAVPLFASFASGDDGTDAATGCSCLGDDADVTWPSTVGDYQAAVPVEEVKAEDEEGAAVDVHGSSVVGSVKTARKAEAVEENTPVSYAGGGGCSRQQ